MNDPQKQRIEQNSVDLEKNKRYAIKDAVDKWHVFISGEQGLNEDWIALLRHDENMIHSSDFHYYFRWNGKEYIPSVVSIDRLSPNELDHNTTMLTSEKDGETVLIEREEREAFLTRFRTAMNQLTDSQRELIRKRCVLGLSDVEIAQQEHVSSAAINHRWERIKRKLNKTIGKLGG